MLEHVLYRQSGYPLPEHAQDQWLEHVLIGKVGTLCRNMLKINAGACSYRQSGYTLPEHALFFDIVFRGSGADLSQEQIRGADEAVSEDFDGLVHVEKHVANIPSQTRLRHL